MFNCLSSCKLYPTGGLFNQFMLSCYCTLEKKKGGIISLRMCYFYTVVHGKLLSFTLMQHLHVCRNIYKNIIFQGMACVGRQKNCSTVPRNHFGPIPDVEVGTLWKFRVQVCS